MSITFRCEHCHKEVKAPDAAGGKRGKCPYCHQSTYIPSPVSEEDILPLAEPTEEEERAEKARIQALYQQEHDLLAQTGSAPVTPLEHREELTTADLHHFVINFCLEMARDRAEAADAEAAKLRKFGPLGLKALEEIASGNVREPALDAIPRRPREVYLNTLRGRLK
jgi:phage FluMu protein Com